MLFLSRSVLRRPWVLAELARAHTSGANVHTVLLEYPGGADNARAFRFPVDLEAAIQEWSWFVLQEGKANARAPSRKPSVSGVVEGVRLRAKSRSRRKRAGMQAAPALSAVDEGRLLGDSELEA